MSDISTKQVILNAALDVFIEKGFAGGAISEIAKNAKVNQSLIYHHFKSKEDLWNEVKKHFIQTRDEQTPHLKQDTLENFVQDMVAHRFAIYKQKPMRRLTHWQALDSNPAQFYAGHESQAITAFTLPEVIKKLQKQGAVRLDVDYFALAGLCFSLVSYAFFDFAEAYSLTTEQINSQETLLVDSLITLLKPLKNV